MSPEKIVVYTAIANAYDSLKPTLALWEKEATFVVFTDKLQLVPGWNTRPIHAGFKDACRNAKIHKILSHEYFPDAEYSLWIDGCVLLKSVMPLTLWVKEYLAQHDLALCKHWCRKCIYQEGAACLQFHWDTPSTVHRQMNKYFSEGFPANNGLAECTVIFRRHTKTTKQLNEAWYHEICHGSRRDQLSFNYVARKLGIEYAHLPGSIMDNPHFVCLPHAKERSKPIKGIIGQRTSSRLPR